MQYWDQFDKQEIDAMHGVEEVLDKNEDYDDSVFQYFHIVDVLDERDLEDFEYLS